MADDARGDGQHSWPVVARVWKIRHGVIPLEYSSRTGPAAVAEKRSSATTIGRRSTLQRAGRSIGSSSCCRDYRTDLDAGPEKEAVPGCVSDRRAIPGGYARGRQALEVR